VPPSWVALPLLHRPDRRPLPYDRPVTLPKPATANVLTVGHSNHSIERFLALLESQRVEVIADVRSHPYSRFVAHFNREALSKALADRGLNYAFFGSELGGRPDGDEFYDDEGHVLYGRVACTDFFTSGVDRLDNGLRRFRVAIMCSEEDPTDCHRRLLVTRVLVTRGVEVVHLRGDGRLQREAGLGDPQQGDLFNGFEETAWRSTRSVSRRRAPIASSAS